MKDPAQEAPKIWVFFVVKVAFAMEKAAVVDLFGTLIAAIGSISCFNFIRPQAYSLSKVYAGLGYPCELLDVLELRFLERCL